MSRRPAPLIALLASAAVVAGCGTGLEAQTYKETGRQDGAFAAVGGRTGVAVHRLVVTAPEEGSTHPAGETAYVTGGLVNNGTSADALVGATSDVGTTVTLLVDGKPVPEVPLPGSGTAPAEWSLALVNLSRDLRVASSVTVTLEFQRAGKVTVQVPVESGDNGLHDRTPEQDPYAEE